MAREDLAGHEHDVGEQRTQEEALQRDGDGGDVELRDEPEQEFEADCQSNVNLNGISQSDSKMVSSGTGRLP